MPCVLQNDNGRWTAEVSTGRGGCPGASAEAPWAGGAQASGEAPLAPELMGVSP